MKFFTKSNLPKVVQSMNIFSEVVMTRPFKSMVEHGPTGTGVQQYPYANTTGWNINCFIINFLKQDTDIEIVLYRPRWPWSKALAMFDKKKPYKLFLNSRKLNRPIDSLVGSIAHEFIHLCDNQSETLSFGHGSNSSGGKQESAAYYIGSMTKALVKEKYGDKI